MEHEEAESTQAADRYLLGELSPEAREEFEEHYFVCTACADEVRAGMSFRANAKAVYQEERARARWRWPAWLGARPAMAASWAAACAVLAFTGYQNYQLHEKLSQATAPQSYGSFALRSATRGGEPVLKVPISARFVGLSVHPDPQRTFPAYRAEFQAEPGERRFSVVRAAPVTPGLPLEFLVSAAHLPQGAYRVELYGIADRSKPQSGTHVGTYRFRIEQSSGE